MSSRSSAESERCLSIATKYTPRGITIRYKRGPKLYPADATLYDASMLAPYPDNREALYYFLHECAHFHLKHFNADQAPTRMLRQLYTGNGGLTEAVQEFEAERWAIATMRMEGLSVPRTMLKEAKTYVRGCKKYAHAPSHVKRFAKR